MPNNVTNEIEIVGTDEQILAVREYMRGDENPFDFNKLSSMPDELVGSKAPTKIISNKDYKLQEKENAIFLKLIKDKEDKGEELTEEESNKLSWGLSNSITQKMSDELIEKHGYDNWYDWQIANWGTKWNSYEHWNMDEMDANEFGFETAWAHPMPIIESLSIQFPHVRFKVRFADEDFGYNLGTYEILDGLIENENFPEGGSVEAQMLALDIQGDDEYYLYDQFVEGEQFSDEDGVEDMDEFQMIMLRKSVAQGSVNGEFPKWILDLALEMALEEENFEEAVKIRDYLKEEEENK